LAVLYGAINPRDLNDEVNLQVLMLNDVSRCFSFVPGSSITDLLAISNGSPNKSATLSTLTTDTPEFISKNLFQKLKLEV
jgi:hypothetical protein